MHVRTAHHQEAVGIESWAGHTDASYEARRDMPPHPLDRRDQLLLFAVGLLPANGFLPEAPRTRDQDANRPPQSQ